MSAESGEHKVEAVEATQQDAEMEAPAGEKPKAPEKAPELEEDAPSDGRAKIPAGAVGFLTEDTTVNVLPAVGGKLLTSLSDGGFQYLLAGARANAGVKAGRHIFEVVIVENKSPSEPTGTRVQGPKPRQLVRVGVATANASLFLSDGGSESVCFDSEGYFISRDKQKQSQRFGHNQVLAVLLNLDEKSPNANTLSLFCNGVRASKPQPLPEHLKGKMLYPVVAYKNVTLQVNFGPRPLRPLPFKCNTWQEAAATDSEVKKPPESQAASEVVLPIGVPDEATFDWVDQFLEKNKGYVELSDRAILEWASKSGLQRQGGYAKRSSNDKPEPNFGLPLMDDLSVKRVLAAVAPSLQRNYVVMEVKGNLLAEDRKAVLGQFAGPEFRKVAHVVMGEAPAEYKAWLQESILKEKRGKAEAEAKRKKAEAARKKAEEARKKKLEEERKKKLEAAKKAKEGKKEGEEEEAETKQAEEEAKMEVEAKEEEQEEEIKVELTEEEKQLCFRKKETPDLSQKELASSYAKFTLASKDEGFDEVKFAWADEAGCQEHLRKWVLERKLTQRVEDLQPSEWFKGKWAEWTKSLNAWKKKQQEFKDPAKRKAAAAAKKKDEEGEKENVQVDAEDLDVFAVEDVTDIGSGEPLFANFVFEDWALLSLRFELHLLVHAFKHDLDDPERTTFHESHLSFYYSKYFKKPFNVKYFGVSKLAELVEMIKDTVEISPKNSTVESQLSEDTPTDNFVKLTEDHRRDRQRRLDAGDETALLKFTRPAPAAPPRQPQGQAQKGWSSQGRSEQPASRSSYGQSAQYGHKRPYTPAPYTPAKQQRTAYGAGSGPRGGGSSYGGGSGSGYGAYRR